MVEAAWVEAGCGGLLLQSQLEEVMTSGPLDSFQPSQPEHEANERPASI